MLPRAPTVLDPYSDIIVPWFVAPVGRTGPLTVLFSAPAPLMPKSIFAIWRPNAVVCAAAMPVRKRKSVAVASMARERLCIRREGSGRFVRSVLV